ncbi:MAG: acyl-CoA dehydrogenase family protein [Bdellovibrionota bacterium]
MDFNLSSTQKDIVDLASTFAKKEIAPFVEQDEANSHFRREIFPKAGAAGLIGITCSAEFGGAELGTTEYALALEQLAQVSSGYATSLSVTALPISILDRFGNPAQKLKYMPSMIQGEKIGAFALTEPNSGSDAAALRTTAVKKGSHYVLNGTKQFITNGPQADVFAVLARTGEAGAKGVSCFIVERGFPGFKGGKLEKKWECGCPTRKKSFSTTARFPWRISWVRKVKASTSPSAPSTAGAFPWAPWRTEFPARRSMSRSLTPKSASSLTYRSSLSREFRS